MDGTTTNQPTVQTPQVARRAFQPDSSEELAQLAKIHGHEARDSQLNVIIPLFEEDKDVY